MKGIKFISIAVIIIVVLTLIALGLFFYLKESADEPQYRDGKLVVNSQQGEVLLNDIYANVNMVLPESETVVFYSEDDALITYNLLDNQFAIVVKKPSARKTVEQKFLQITGLSQPEACQLNVLVGIPYEVNPNASQSFNLSFCP